MNNGQNGHGYPDSRYAWYVIAILFTAYTLSFVDRLIMSLLIEPIKRDLVINDTQVSLLTGLAFAIFYTVMGIPLGRLADSRNRKVIISIGIFFWSMMTAVCGLARGFWTLFAGRVGVGIGEACLSPAAYSMISDYFPEKSRGLAASLYSMGIFFGAGMAFIAGGAVVQLVSNTNEVVLPLLGVIRPWQLTFFIVGLPGLIVVALMTTVKEPVRRGLIAARSGSNALSIGEAIDYLVKRWRTYATMILGISLMATMSYGFFNWIPSMFIRTYQWEASEIGYTFGLLVVVFGTSGIVFGGVLASRMLARGVQDAYIRVIFYSAGVVTVCGVGAVVVPSDTLALVLLCPTIFCLGFHVGNGPAAVTHITPNQLRGQGIAVFYFVLNILGQVVGPLSIASITDYVFREPLYLRYSMAIFTLVAGTLAFFVLMAGMNHYRSASAEFHEKSA